MGADIGFANQTPALPGGGASVGGLGETFTPDLSTGTGTFAVALDVPHGPNDIAPRLSLRYDTGSPNGPFGLGWSLAMPRLLRSTADGPPHYDERDTLVLEGSGPLVSDGAGGLHPQVDSGDWRVSAAAAGYVVTDRAGTRFMLGTTPDSQMSGPTGVPWAWLLHSIEDNLGNAAALRWEEDGDQRYLASIAYGPYEVRLQYEQRPDVLRWALAGALVLTTRRCVAVELHLLADPAGTLVRRWSLSYEQADPNGQSLLVEVALTGVDATGAQLAAPPLKLRYTTPDVARLVRLGSVDAGAVPPPLDGTGRVELVDWDGDGLPDVLALSPHGEARVWRNRVGRWDRPELVGNVSRLSDPAAHLGLADLDGDGLADLVRLDRPAGGYQPRTVTGLAHPVSWARSPSVALGAPTAKLADLDGDGLPDLLWSSGGSLLLASREVPGGPTDTGGSGDGWSEHPLVVPGAPSGPPTDLRDPHVFCADMTGDGSADLVRIDGSGVKYWPYLGGGRFGTPVTMAAPPELPFGLDARRMFVVDVDGDGCADVVVLDHDAVRWWPNNTGSSFGPAREIRHVPTGAIRAPRLPDVLGTGVPALCWTATVAGRTAWFALDLLGGRRPGLLAEIDNGVGATTTITYSTSALEVERDRSAGRGWLTRLPIALSVVGEITTTDTAGPAHTGTVRYRYHDGRFDGVLREFCGFGVVEQDDVGDQHVPTLRTTRRFHTGRRDDGAEPATLAERRRLRAIRGRLVSVQRATDDGHVFDRVEYAWEVADGPTAGTLRPRQRSMTTSTLEGDATPVSWIVTENLAWDASGNVVRAEERSYERSSGPGVPTPAAVLRTEVTFVTDPTGRYLQRAARVVQTDGTGAVIADARTIYDGLAPGQIGGQGLVTGRSALAMPDALVADVYGAETPDFTGLGYRAGDGGWWVDLARYQRTDDATGLRGRVTGPRGEVSQIEFDPSRCFASRVTDPASNVVSAVHDLRVCRPSALTDASGQTTTARYDPLARILAFVRPGDTDVTPGISYDYRTDTLPVRITTNTRTGAATGPTVLCEFHDGTGRLLQRQHVDDTGVIVQDATEYGSRGLPVRVFSPYRSTAGEGVYAPPPAGTTSNELYYDALGRPATTVRADGARRTVTHLPGAIEEADEEDLRTGPGATHAGTVTRQVLDAAGRARAVEQRLGVRTLRASYEFDVKGRLRSQTDAGGATSQFTHDLLGRLLRVRRPEQVSIGVFDPSGNQVESRIGSARAFRSYDSCSRVIAIRHDTAAAAPVVRCSYHDGGAPPPDSGVHTAGGRLVRVDHEAGSAVFDYDPLGRVARKTMTPNGQGALQIDIAYRPDGVLDRVTYPAAAAAARPEVSYRYDRAGRLAAIDGVIDAIAYDLSGRRTETRYANGTVQTAAFDQATGWLTASRLTSAAAGGATLRDLTYTHDLTGNLTSIASPDAAMSWSYAYDDLYRLVEARTGAEAITYSYDDTGNLLTASDRGSYAYGGGSASPTQLAAISGAGAPQAFGYDDRGNVTSASWGTHTIDAEGRLRRVALSAGGDDVFDYDHTGTLARRRSTTAAGATTELLTPDTLIELLDGVLTCMVSDGQRSVARLHADGSRTWLHFDHLGSLSVLTDASGAVVLDVRYGPYGEVRSRTGAARARQGFGTGEAAGPSLVLLGARWYCPAIGRFLSPDPVVGEAYDPLAWNAYAYCRGNPTSLIDPSGRSFWKLFAAIVATVAIIAVAVIVTVCTFGAAGPGAIALSAAGISLTWGAVFAVTVAGIVIGGVVGGIAAARAGGDAGDIVLGALVGGAVGGWAAFGAAFAGPAVAGVFGLHGGVAGGAVAGAVSGTINGAAMGFASGFAGGRNNGLGDIMTKVLVGALIGAAVGAALGAVSGMTPPKNPPTQNAEGLPTEGSNVTPGQALQKSLTPDAPTPTNPGVEVGPGVPGGAAAPVQSATPLGMAGQAAGRILGPQAAIILPGLSGFTGSIITQTIAVDLHAGAASLLFDDLKDYLRTHNVDIGPIKLG